MKNSLIYLIIFLLLILPGCITTNQLHAERAYYEMHARIKKAELDLERERLQSRSRAMEKIESQKVLEIIAGDPGKPMVFENVASINAYALPQIPQEPIILNAGNSEPVPQYRQQDFITPIFGFLGKIGGLVVGGITAYKIIDSIGKHSGDSFNMTNYGQGSEQTYTGATDISSSTIGGDVNLHSDFTHEPLVVQTPDPTIVRPEVVEPIVIIP